MQVSHGSSTQREAQDWQSALDRALEAHGGEAALAHYPHVANAFPSRSPNPHTGDFPLLDYRELKEWATYRGWRVRPAPERASEGEEYNPPVRFTRLEDGSQRFH
ncbi:hypothetical protein QWY79_04310 [Halomonas sabkhae]|uniref:hypothetical protein n=1 Tax=Halomonas sabkhae TaxID=626223 RepID=UPI0025B42868|nr:hypothetical protein [Halomonas sabkhae]MDN3524483.1 hypothetical protein [Halomonas sabkhae]